LSKVKTRRVDDLLQYAAVTSTTRLRSDRRATSIRATHVRVQFDRAVATIRRPNTCERSMPGSTGLIGL